MSERSITQWLDGLKAGDEVAARKLWETFFEKLIQLARKKLRHGDKRVSDEEDVALSALDSFCRGAASGRFPQLKDRTDLWRLLLTITERKATRHLKFAARQKRGGGRVSGESAFGTVDPMRQGGMDQAVATTEPTPDMAMEVAENIQVLLKMLDDATLRHVAVAKMEGFTNDEIAEQLGCSTRSVKRRLQVIRTIWLEHEIQTGLV